MKSPLSHFVTFVAATLILLPLGAPTSMAQDFSDTNLGLPNLFEGMSDWGDYDNDGDLDLLMAGAEPTVGEYIRLFRNDSGVLIPVESPFPGIHDGSVSWGDYNRDGYLDVLIIGYVSVNGIMSIYENDGSGGFFDIGGDFPDVFRGTGTWGDYDNDGDLDFVSTFDELGPGAATSVFRNDGDGVFSRLTAGIDNINRGSVDWGDYDNDGDLDILIIGETRDFEFVSRIYRNDGADSFSDIGSQLYPVVDGRAVWGDYDADGDLDILFSGTDSLSRVVVGVYRNDGDDQFTYLEEENSGGGVAPSAAWGDFDNDGDLDFVIIGGFLSKTVLFRNDGDDVFSRIDDVFANGCCGSIDWGDYDGDGDLDIALSGIGINPARLYRNDESLQNNPPTAPSGLVSEVDNGIVTLSWEPSDDDHTPTPGLTYNVRLGMQPGGVDVLSPMSDPATGFRRIAGEGNAGHNTFKRIKNLPDGVYYWSVQAVDNSFEGSAFAPEESFMIAQTAVDDSPNQIGGFEIRGVYPNPFNKSTTLEYYLPEETMVRAAIYDLMGRKVITLIDDRRAAGNYHLKWNAGNLSSGVYFFRIWAGEFTATARLSLLK